MPERDGFHVVATFEAGAAPTQPVLQVGATLTAGQSIVVALPGAVGGAPDAIRIARHGNTVVVKKATGLAERD